MNNRHLTDEALQAFVLKEIQDDTVAVHLSVCADCREKIKNYQYLVDNIQKVAPESFSFDVTTVVMDSVVKYKRRETVKQKIGFWILLTFLSLIVLSFAIPFLPRILMIFDSISIFKTLFIVGTGFAVIFFLLADLSRQYKLKEKKLFENNLQPTL